MKPIKILIVEDDRAVSHLLGTALDVHGYNFQTAKNGQEAIMLATSHMPDVIILDLGLPDMDGVEIIKKIRTWSSKPILVVSARSEDKDKIEALDAGADDYLTKPFSVDELLARIRVAIRKMNYDDSPAKDEPVFVNGGMRIDYAAGSVTVDGKEVHLTPIEYRLLCLFSKNVGKVLTHNFILKEVWGSTMQSDIPSLRVFMATLRKKIEKGSNGTQYFQTHITVGYRLNRIQEDSEEKF